MLPITAGIEKTKFNILLYAFLMLPAVVVPFFTGFGSIIYLILSLSMTIYYINLCYQLFKTRAVSKSNIDPKNERKTDNAVDAIAGATITGDGIAAMIRKDLRMYMPYLQTLKN